MRASERRPITAHVDAATYAQLVQLSAEYQLSLSALATMALHDLLEDEDPVRSFDEGQTRDARA